MRPPIDCEALRVLEEVDDLLDLVLRFVDAGDVRERDRHELRVDRPRFLERRHAAGDRAEQREAGEAEQQQAEAPWRRSRSPRASLRRPSRRSGCRAAPGR